MNLSIQHYSIQHFLSRSPIIIQKSNTNVLSCSFSYLASYIFRYDNRFNSQFSKSVFKYSLTPIVLKSTFYPIGAIYQSTNVPSMAVYEDCGFINIIHTGSDLVVYSNANGVFRMERCTFHTVQTAMEWTTTVKVEPINFAILRYNCFQKVQAHMISFSIGWWNKNNNHVSCSDLNVQNSNGNHACLSLGKITHHLDYTNCTSNPLGSGIWIHDGIMTGSISRYHSVVNCSGSCATGTNLNIEISLQYYNVINNQFSHGIFFVFLTSTIRIFDWCIVKYSPL